MKGKLAFAVCRITSCLASLIFTIFAPIKLLEFSGRLCNHSANVLIFINYRQILFSVILLKK